MPKVVGVDLAVPGKGLSGAVRLDAVSLAVEDYLLTRSLVDIEEFVLESRPHVAVVDAPLRTAPAGQGFRSIERWAARKLGARFLPLTLASMRLLAEAGEELRRRLSWLDLYETHPSSAARIAGAPSVEEFLRCIGVSMSSFASLPRTKLRHVLDAAVAAAVGALIRRGAAVLNGAEGDALALPKPGLCGRLGKRLIGPG
jgi:predicted nuclease with RNAse H fold